jgi:hypothetical protein
MNALIVRQLHLSRKQNINCTYPVWFDNCNLKKNNFFNDSIPKFLKTPAVIFNQCDSNFVSFCMKSNNFPLVDTVYLLSPYDPYLPNHFKHISFFSEIQNVRFKYPNVLYCTRGEIITYTGINNRFIELDEFLKNSTLD